ncbi:hypothetical protein IN07_14930 [Modestobacter caceresii]|uniref:DUF5655 domain-containing protein n=1 Tax=Modestobacter caceresii TaxID=1522368 RepID=A0A098Y5Z5_9ACTN|nr:hypothetical protein [Modestobacter caceresii]KGH45840.1 hypothetical protein IN07_14930 [Modestobacter caceresii]
MNGELVFTVTGASAVAATPISLADAGLKERQHLQEWVIAHPQVLGPSVKIVAFEFGSWTGYTGEKEKDRLDVLALDSDGHLIVVELKRDKAPDTVEMQALKYAALVSRFTRVDLDKVHARYLSKQTGTDVSVEQAAEELDAWATITEESLRQPTVILMASDFPQTVTATVVFLHQQLGLDIKLLVFQAYQTANDVLITVSQHYPPPGIEEFVLSPEVNEAQKAKSTKQSKQREISTVARLIEADVLSPGEHLKFQAPSADLHAQMDEWLDAAPGRRVATWQDDVSAPLVWEADGKSYSPTGLARLILEEAAGRTSQVQGPLYWINEAGQSLVELAASLPPAAEVPLAVHTGKLSEALTSVWESFDEALMGLAADITRQSRVKSIKYYRKKKLCDLLVHGDHISVYIRGMNVAHHPVGAGGVVGGTSRYIHTQMKSPDDIPPVLAFLQQVYDKQGE